MKRGTRTTILNDDMSRGVDQRNAWKKVVVVMRNPDAMKISQPTRLARKPALWALALGIAMAPVMSGMAQAESFDLSSVDFATNGDKTDIILHTGSIVPVNKVEVTETKMVLDIDNINTEETIRTNFSGARNISHVIMQPLNDHKIRMIIRGENLGKPSVAFQTSSGLYGATNPNFRGEEPDTDKLSAETAAALKQIQDSGTRPAVLGNADLGDEKPAVDEYFTGEEPATLAATEEPVIQPAPTSAKPIAELETENAPLSLGESKASKPGIQNDFFKPGAVGSYETWIPYGLLALVLLGAGGFVAHKLRGLKRQEPSLEDLINEQASGKRVGFREMATAYRSKHDTPISEAMADKSGSRKPNAEDVIGLRSLKHLEDTPAAPQQPAAKPEPVMQQDEAKVQAKKLESLISAMQTASQPKAPMKTTPPKKQVVNQYVKSQPPVKKPKTRDAAEQAMYNEQLKRAQDVQNAVQQEIQKRAAKPGISSPANPINRAPAAQKAVKDFQPKSISAATHPVAGKGRTPVRPQAPAAQPASGPLPGNPEVLNFLRNVADLMEKDGKGEIAKSIHKNLNPQNLGLT